MALPPYLKNSGTQFYNPSLGSAWDIAYLDVIQIPGIVKCVPKTSRKVDVANGPGLSSATLRLQGVDPGTFSLAIVTWTPEQLAELEFLLKKVAPIAGQTKYANGRYTTTPTPVAGSKAKPPRPASFTFYHPAASAAGIESIIVEGVEWFAEGPVKQSKMVTLDCKQALPTKPVVSGTPQLNAPNLGGVPNAPNPANSAGKRGT